jgi:hypothetical protein
MIDLNERSTVIIERTVVKIIVLYYNILVSSTPTTSTTPTIRLIIKVKRNINKRRDEKQKEK